MSGGATPRGRGPVLRAAAGIAISVIAFALVVRTVDLEASWAALRAADLRWIGLVVGLIAVDVALRALRWRILLAPVAQVSYRTTLGALLVGYLANNVLPARLGELVRSHAMGERAGISRSTVLGTVVVERVVDTVVVVAIAAAAILVLSVRGIVASGVLVGLALSALLVVLVGLGIVAHRIPGADRLAGVIDRWPQVRDVLGRLRSGLAVAGRPRTVIAAVALTVASWSSAVLAFAAAAQAVGIEPTIGQAALLAAGVNLATAIPSAPGYVGTFELAAVTIAASVGIPEAPALAFALLLHGTSLLLTSLGGSAVAIRSGWSGLRASADGEDDARSRSREVHGAAR